MTSAMPYGALLPPQESPRAVHLLPEGLFLPAPILRMMFASGDPMRLRYTGHALAPFLTSGKEFELRKLDAASLLGQLVLVDVGGWGDVRRVFAVQHDSISTGLDAFSAREMLKLSQVIGIVEPLNNALSQLGTQMVHRTAAWPSLAGQYHRFQRIRNAITKGAEQTQSIGAKYQGQVESYDQRTAARVDTDKAHRLLALLSPGCRVLVAGCGTGSEAIGFAKQGYQVDAFDLVPDMILAAEKNARAHRVDARFFVGDLESLERAQSYQLIYLTARIYSFIQGRRGRIAMLARLGNLLRPDGSVVFSAKVKSHRVALDPGLAWMCSKFTQAPMEWGDWYTWYVSPKGTVERSYSHIFFGPKQVLREAKHAGFAKVVQRDTHFIASEFRGTRVR